MPILKEIGFVISSRVVNEIDCIITVLSENSPKAKFIIKGIKKSKTRSILSTEPGSLVSIDYYSKGDSIHNVKEISLIERFEKAKTGYFNYLLIHYFCELTDQFLAEGETYTKCFKIFRALLKILDSSNFNLLILPFYKSKFLLELGFLSNEFYCSECNSNVLELNSSHIASYTLDIICSNCQNTYSNNISIIRLLNLMTNRRYNELKDLDIDKSLILETDSVLSSYIRNHLNRDLKTTELLYQQIKLLE